LLDTADTSGEPSVLGGNVDVSFISPSWSPGVSDDVVFLSVLLSITNSGDGVIEGSSTGRGVHDTTGITLEGSGVGLNGNGSWSLSNSSKKSRRRPSFDGVNSGNVSNWGSFLLAGSGVSGTRGVWVGGLGGLTVGLNVLHTVGLPTTIATSAFGIAGNKLLFREGNKVSGLDEVVSFNGASG